MPADLETQFMELRHTIDILQERLCSAEEEICRLNKRVSTLQIRAGRFPFLVPSQTRTKVAIIITSALGVITLAIAVSPKDIHIGDWHYESEGIPVEAATSLATLAGVFITLRNHFKDKEELVRRTEDESTD